MRLDLFPGFGIPVEPGYWRLMVAGVARQEYVPTVSKRMLIRMLGSAMDASDEELTHPEFVRRVSPFVADGAGKLPVRLRVGDHWIGLKKRTRRNGHFRQGLLLDGNLVERHVRTDRHGRQWLPMDAMLSAEARRNPDGSAGGELTASGEIWLVPPAGWSVISDVDDTIKESGIGDRRELLLNTFLRSFRAVPGMAGLYSDWAARGVQFHYVSTSPCQLLHPLVEMRNGFDFPGGSLHLRNFRLRNHVLKKLARIRRSSKSSIIRKLIELQPQRRFLLIGDAGETDIEIYRKAASKFPRRVAGVFIRRLDHEEFPDHRFVKASRSVPSVPFFQYSTAEELALLAGPILQQPL